MAPLAPPIPTPMVPGVYACTTVCLCYLLQVYTAVCCSYVLYAVRASCEFGVPWSGGVDGAWLGPEELGAGRKWAELCWVLWVKHT